MSTIATSASYTAHMLIENAILVHYNGDNEYHREQLRATIKKLRVQLDAVEAFLDRTEPTENAA